MLQENRIATPILFSLLLLIVFFIWVNVMVAIISDVYSQEVDRSLSIAFDPEFPCLRPDTLQPENDVGAMQPHMPVQTHENVDMAAAEPVALMPDRCGSASGQRACCAGAHALRGRHDSSCCGRRNASASL